MQATLRPAQPQFETVVVATIIPAPPPASGTCFGRCSATLLDPAMPSNSDVPSRALRKPDFIKYPYPERARVLSYLENLRGVKDESKKCITNLLAYRAVRTHARLPRGQSAAVLVPLFVGRSGDLYVLLSRRSDKLRAFSGDTALPGGKVDAQDGTVEDTARREAFEEIGLPQDKERVPLLCVMEPHLAKGDMVVTPVVVIVLDNNLQPNLNSSEVTSIFAQPLAAFLSSTAHLSSSRTADPSISYHTFTDSSWGDSGAIRLHSFLTGREGEGVKPVFGLTASILIKTATIGYGRQPEFEVQPPNAPTSAQQIAHALLNPANPLRIACEQEGLDASKAAARLLRPPVAANAARMIEWEKIGMEWKEIMESNDAAQVEAVIAKGNRSGPSSQSPPWDRDPAGQGLDQDGNRQGMEDSKAGEYRKQRMEEKESSKEHGERGEGWEDSVPNMARLGEFLDKVRDMVNERMAEVKSDEKKLSKARKVYPKIAEQVKKQLEAAQNEDGEFDLKALFTMIPKEDQEGLSGVKAGKEKIQCEKADGERKDRGVRRGEQGLHKGSEEMKECIGNGRDDRGPKQARRKHDAKL